MSSLMGNGPVEFSKGFEKLFEEHKGLRQQLRDLSQTVELLYQQVEKAGVFADLRKKVSAFFGELEAHSEKEESILFPMIETYIGKSGGPITVMEYEHEEAKRLIQSFLTQSDKETTEEEMVKYSILIGEAYSLLISHFMKEENVLYPMGERFFSESEKEELYVKVAG